MTNDTASETYTFFAGTMAAETVSIPDDSRPVRYGSTMTGDNMMRIARSAAERHEMYRATDGTKRPAYRMVNLGSRYGWTREAI